MCADKLHLLCADSSYWSLPGHHILRGQGTLFQTNQFISNNAMEYCRSATNGGTRRHDRGDQRHKLYSPEECTYTCVVKTCSSCVTPHWLMTLLHIRCTHTSHQGAKQERIFAMMSMFVFCQVWEKIERSHLERQRLRT